MVIFKFKETKFEGDLKKYLVKDYILLKVSNTYNHSQNI